MKNEKEKIKSIESLEKDENYHVLQNEFNILNGKYIKVK